MFQAGEVDYLVATDAIGMGLNMDLDHVAFARLAKFDGRGPRRLSAAEIGQIAGRAGRHMSDGTFGTTADEGPLDPEIVAAVEEHRFEPLTRISWRNIALNFNTVGALAQQPRRAAAGAGPDPDPRRRRPPGAARAVAQRRGRGAGDQPGGGAAVVGGLPDPRFPQGDERQPRALPGAVLPASRRADRAPADAAGSPGRSRSSTASTATSTR